ncbi:8-oxo-dGTP diphosphatase [Halovivax gelatinilyticus]|uniref:8-oxo-dGTP diphosphatase n=1 Tax=Halovivax gelatinilyticus TaxID=2961597 RepID=UPI0020CA59B1|nr:8-oxo-dGTP diphosphatase [Halovivax gelatinilyticus]
MIEGTLCFVVRADEVLLIEKRRGLGAGWYNGPGGKREDGETHRECVIREVREEVGIDVDTPSLERAGVLTFHLDGEAKIECQVFRTDRFEGEPTASDEARPEWFAVDDVPYDRMWEDDRHWLPGVIEGWTVRGEFYFEGGEPLDEAEFVEYDLEWDVAQSPTRS